MMGTDKIRSNLALEPLINKLGGFPFLRCHRSYIVNLIHISDMLDKDFVMEDGSRVPIRAYQSASAKAFKEFVRAALRGVPL